MATIKKKLTAIGDAVRSKLGITDKMTLSTMTTKVKYAPGEDDIAGILNGTITHCYNDQASQVAIRMFYGNTNLKAVDMPNVDYVKNYAFYGCEALESVAMPLKTIGNYAFYTCDVLNEIDLSEVESIGDYAFTACYELAAENLEKLTSIGKEAFKENALTSLNIPSLTTTSYAEWLSCSNLKEVNAPNLLTIGDSTFELTALEHVTFPVVTTIKTEAFSRCYNLVSITIETETVCTLANKSAFNNCTALESIFVPDDLVDSYKTATNWTNYADYIKPISEKEATT